MIKVLELFSGYGGAGFALKKANIEHKTIGYSDIEKCANYIFSLNHGNDIPELGDITEIVPEQLEDFDLLTGGFPCQSFSMAGKRQGFKAANKGKLFFEIIRIAEIKKPRWMLLENVEGILSHDNGRTFRVVLEELMRIGYTVSWKKLYSKNHGTPQNRPRIWIACFREYEDAKKFIFPEKEKLKLVIKDLLEKEVEIDKKYYLKKRQLETINAHLKRHKEKGNGFGNEPTDLNKPCKTLKSINGKIEIAQPYFNVYNLAHTKANGKRFKNDGCSFTLEATPNQSQCVKIPNKSDKLIQLNNPVHSNNRIYSEEGICPTLRNMSQGGNRQPFINTITTSYGRQGLSKEFMNINKQVNDIADEYRRLTPKECFRLQGFFNDEINFGDLSDSKLYFLAGNGWDINVASKIFKQLFVSNSNKQKSLWEIK